MPHIPRYRRVLLDSTDYPQRNTEVGTPSAFECKSSPGMSRGRSRSFQTLESEKKKKKKVDCHQNNQQ